MTRSISPVGKRLRHEPDEGSPSGSHAPDPLDVGISHQPESAKQPGVSDANHGAGDEYFNDHRSECRRWRTIVIDPPWAFQQSWHGRYLSYSKANGTNGKGHPLGKMHYKRGSAANYRVMPLEALAGLPIRDVSEDNAHLYLWVTNTHMREAYHLVDAWGFVPKTILTWIKPRLGMGTYYRNCTEHVVFAVRGSLKVLRHDARTYFMAPQGRHSQKPDAFYDLVETMSPGPYLDVFARRQRMLWDVAGNEVYSAIPELQ